MVGEGADHRNLLSDHLRPPSPEKNAPGPIEDGAEVAGLAALERELSAMPFDGTPAIISRHGLELAQAPLR